MAFNARKIVERKLKNVRVVEAAPAADTARSVRPDAVSPDLATLRRKYGLSAAADTEALPDAPDDTETVVVEPLNAAQSRGPCRRAVTVSKRTGKIISIQG
jgi:hypothetical protein